MIMKLADAVRQMIKEKKTTQRSVALKMGYKSQSPFGTMLSRGNMNVTTLVKIANLLDYEVVLQPVKPGKKPEGQIAIEMSDSK